MVTPIPSRLIEEVMSGNAVAFVGGGFSALAVPPWRELLQHACATCEVEATRARVEKLLARPRLTSGDLEAAAQLLQDGRREAFVRSIREAAAPGKLDERTRRRKAWLLGIPFAAIVTTNFDDVLPGQIPSAEAYLSVLRPKGHRWWNERFWAGERQGPEVVKLHGDITRDEDEQQIILSRRDYRLRLYESPGYTTFLKALFATKTVLYLGFSFTDDYVNELRSEILALVGHRETDQPLAFAVVNDVDEEERAYQRRHEGIEILTYPAHEPPGFNGFDEIMETLFRATSPRFLLGRCLSGKRLLWVDPKPRNNDYGMDFLRSAAALVEDRPCVIETVNTWEEGLRRLDAEPDAWDLVISHWGWRKAVWPDGSICSVGERLLHEKRLAMLPSPLVILSGSEHAVENRRAALRAGAIEYATSWEDLFRLVARVLGDGVTGLPMSANASALLT